MSEFGRKVVPGQKNLQYGAWNRLIAKNTQPNIQPPEIVNAPRDYDLVNVENTAGYAVDPFGILQTKTATWEERGDETFSREGMRRGVEIQGEAVESEWDNITVTQKSIPDTAIMPGVISGPTPCMVLYPDAASLEYPYAIPIPNDSAKLQASPYGKNRILWHAIPGTEQSGCDARTLQSFVNMGDDSQWVWFKLQGDLCPCSSASALLVDECGEQIGDCPIVKTVWVPTPHDDDTPTCACGSGESANLPVGSDSGCWKEGDILPFWWFQYLEKWITLPKEPANTSGWAVILQQPPQIVCTAVEVAGVTTCAAALVTPRKKLTVVNGCACLTTESSVMIDLPTPDLVGVPTLAIDTGDATGADDDPCTCSMATLSFPVTPMSWCAGCASDSRTETVTFPVPPENGGHFDAVTSVTISDGQNCGDVSLCTTTHGYTLTCGGLCPDATLESTCTNVHLFDTDDIEYVTGVSLNNITLDVTSTPTTVVTGGSVTASECSAWCTYDRASGLDWSNTVWNIALPTKQVSVVKSLVITNGQVTSVNYETLDVIDPDGTTAVTLTGGPSIVNAPAALSFTFTPTVSFTPTTTTVNSVTGTTATGGTISTTTAQKTVLICGSSET